MSSPTVTDCCKAIPTIVIVINPNLPHRPDAWEFLSQNFYSEIGIFPPNNEMHDGLRGGILRN